MFTIARQVAGDQKPALADATREEWSQLIDDVSKSVIGELTERDPASATNFREIRTQLALGEAQRTFAATPDKDLLRVLTELVVETAREDAASFRDILLRQCIELTSKLTSRQLNTLAAMLLISRTGFPDSNGPVDLLSGMNDLLAPFVGSISTASTELDHLVALGCGTEFQLRPEALGGLKVTFIAQFFESNEYLLYESFEESDIPWDNTQELLQAKLIRRISPGYVETRSGSPTPPKFRLDDDFARKVISSRGVRLPTEAEFSMGTFARERFLDQNRLRELMVEQFGGLYSVFETLDSIDSALFMISPIGRMLGFVNAVSKLPALRETLETLLLDEAERPIAR